MTDMTHFARHARAALAAGALTLLAAPGAWADDETAPEPASPEPAAEAVVSETAAQAEAACSGLKYRQMDFWLGSWELTWVGQDGTVGKGVNEITASLDGCVIEERFSGETSMPLRGMSVSMYHRQKEEWRQLWLDNTGGYLPFIGGPKGNDFILSLQNPEEGGNYRRMLWTNIAADSLDWHWQKSEDKGETWEDIWHIRYVRQVQ